MLPLPSEEFSVNIDWLLIKDTETYGATSTHMPEASGWPAASFANPITSLMVSENICQRLITLIYLTWQNLAIWPLPCSVSILKPTLKIVNSPENDAATENWTHTKNTEHNFVLLWGSLYPARFWAYTTDPDATGSCSICLCNFIFWVFVTCMLSEALQLDRMTQTQVTACYTLPSPFKPKTSQSWLQKVTSMIACVAPYHSCAHNYLSEGCMRHAGRNTRGINDTSW